MSLRLAPAPRPMVVTCPRCRRSLSSVSADGQPLFCMYCGQKLKDGAPPQAETRTGTFTPRPDEHLSGVDDTEDAPGPEPAPAEVGGYKIVKLLGAGGMGAVYEAESPGSGARVAVKLLSSRLAANPSSVERFRQEGRLASQLAHPRCVFVLSADTENGRPYIVMELMPGRTLKDLVDERGPLSEHDAITRVLDVIDGLAEAHRVGMIHRDVKPSNCFLTADDRVKVGDFGLSKSLAGAGRNQLTQTGAFLGTVLFASPEQIRGEPLDYSSDVYSVAATLYFLLSGEAPFHHDNAAAALARAISEAPPRIRATRKDVSARLERVITKGLERDRARRFQTLDDLREALVDLLPERQRPARPRALVAAYLLDRIAVALVAAPLEALRLSVGGGPVHIDLFEIRWLSITILLAYFAIGEGLFGATPGKWLLGLRVSRTGTTGPPGVGRALVRTVVFHALLAGLFFVPEELVRWLGAGTGGALGTAAIVLCAAALLVQVRKKWGYRGPHDFASGCHVTQKPLPARKLRLLIRHPTPLETVLPPAADALPDAVGGYVVRGRLSADSNGEQVWLAEDRALGRAVLLWLRPWGAPALGADPARPTRLRRLGHGSLGWGGAAFDWVAFAAPVGGPLAEAIRPGHPVPWADACHLLEQLVEEFRAAEADGSLPPRLALDHVWVEPNGRVQLLDFPLCEARYRQNTPLAVLREAASLAIEGHPRSMGGGVSAPLPAHALAVLNRLFEIDVPLAEFQKELTEARSHRPEVTPAVRAGHLGIQAAALALPLAALFGLAFTISVGMTHEAEIRAARAKRTAEALADPVQRAKLTADKHLDAAIVTPRTAVRLRDHLDRTRAEAETRRASLLAPQRIMLDAYQRSLPEVAKDMGFSATVPEVILWAGAPDKSALGRADAPRKEGMLPTYAVFVVIPVGMVLAAFAFRGGISMLLAGIAVVRADGRPATRRTCAVRAALVWTPVVALLLVSTLLQIHAPEKVYLAALLFLLAVVLLPVYAFVALRFPARPPHDRLVGTYLVPV